MGWRYWRRDECDCGVKTDGQADGTATARIDNGILRKAKLIASSRNVSVAEYLSSVLQAPVDRDFLKEMKSLEGGGKDTPR